MKHRLISLALIAAVAVGATCAWTYTLQYSVTASGTGYFEKWTDKATAPVTVTMAYNLTFPLSFGSSNPNPAVEIGRASCRERV